MIHDNRPARTLVTCRVLQAIPDLVKRSMLLTMVLRTSDL